MKLYITEPVNPSRGPIVVCDGHNNDIAEFFHRDSTTVHQSYETALMLAQALVGVVSLPKETPCALLAHIADQKRRYQTVILSHEQADFVVALLGGSPVTNGERDRG
jgi:hypothetical protein